MLFRSDMTETHTQPEAIDVRKTSAGEQSSFAKEVLGEGKTEAAKNSAVKNLESLQSNLDERFKGDRSIGDISKQRLQQARDMTEYQAEVDRSIQETRRLALQEKEQGGITQSTAKARIDRILSKAYGYDKDADRTKMSQEERARHNALSQLRGTYQGSLKLDREIPRITEEQQRRQHVLETQTRRQQGFEGSFTPPPTQEKPNVKKTPTLNIGDQRGREAAAARENRTFSPEEVKEQRENAARKRSEEHTSELQSQD